MLLRTTFTTTTSLPVYFVPFIVLCSDCIFSPVLDVALLFI